MTDRYNTQIRWDKGSPWSHTYRLRAPQFTVSAAEMVLGYQKESITAILTLTEGAGITITTDGDDILIVPAVTGVQTEAQSFDVVYFAIRLTTSNTAINPFLLDAGRIRLYSYVVT